MRPIKFHHVSGSSIQLLGDRSEALKVTRFSGGGLCFSNRPLESGDKLLLRTCPELRDELRFGVTEKDPSTLERSFLDLKDLNPGYDPSSGIYAAPDRGVTGEASKGMELDILVYFEPENCRLMVHDVVSRPKERITGVKTKKPMYLVVVLGKCDLPLKIRHGTEIPPIPLHPQSSYFRNLFLGPAYFEPFSSAAVQVRSHFARSLVAARSSNKFAVVNTLLKPGLTLVVNLLEAKPDSAVRIVLTNECADRAYLCANVSELCNTADHSFIMDSGAIDREEELAIRIMLDGAVCVSHNNRGWTPIMRVNADLVYHVVFEMENVPALSLVGITSTKDEKLERSKDNNLDGPLGVENLECNTS